MHLKPVYHTLFTLFVAAGLFLLAASGVSCGGNGAEETVSASVDSLARADTLALVKGLQLFEDGEYENAREQLRVSARSASNYIRAESFLYLNAVEMELGNYDVARAHLDRYHAETVRLLRGVADASQRTAEQTVHLRRRQDSIIIWTVVVAVIMVGTALFFWRKGAVRSQVSIDGNDSATGRRVLPPVDTSAWKGWLVDAEIFKQLYGPRLSRWLLKSQDARRECFRRRVRRYWTESFQNVFRTLRLDCEPIIRP